MIIVIIIMGVVTIITLKIMTTMNVAAVIMLKRGAFAWENYRLEALVAWVCRAGPAGQLETHLLQNLLRT